MLAYGFMQKALLVGFFLGLIIPLMGVIVVNRKTSTIGDALSHTSLAGIGLGLILGISPVIGAIIATILGAFSIEVVRRHFPNYGDMATAIVMSTGIGLASVFSDFVSQPSSFESFLFGSIVTVTNAEVYASIFISILILLMFFVLYYQLLYLSIDTEGARLAGIKRNRVEFTFTLFLAITIAISSRIIGVLVVSSLITIPVACAITLSLSYRKTIISSMLFGVIFVMLGLVISFYNNLKPGGAIVLTGVVMLILLLILRSVVSRTSRKTKDLEEEDLNILGDEGPCFGENCGHQEERVD